VASYLEARTHSGRWLVRIEDLDRPRVIAGMADQHLRTLESFGFQWDGEVRVQSAHNDVYEAALERLKQLGQVYECTCSRAEIAALAPRRSAESEEELHYPGLCRAGARHHGRAAAWRFVAPDRDIVFADRWQPERKENVAQGVGDFIVRRRDGIVAYQLAVVIDDALQGVTDVVRGCDLAGSTSRQILLQEALGLQRPAYAHAPLIVAAGGQKLSKSAHAIGVDSRAPSAILATVLTLLAQSVPRELARAQVAEVWTWAVANWRGELLYGLQSVAAPAGPEI
jgi:glutamyl-Q tRNA(Asp) synthetase